MGCNHNERSAPGSAPAAEPVQITQFYAASPVLPRDESTSLCYGVEHAAGVRIDPPVERVWPAFSRCFPVSPKETTTYTLTADDGHGKSATRSVTISMTGPRPHLDDLSISAQEVAPGQLVTFCFKGRNATSVRGGPGHFLRGGSPQNDCLADNPRQTTAYKITVTGAGGQTDEASFTVKVR
jgi:hypothetical protein